MSGPWRFPFAGDKDGCHQIKSFNNTWTFNTFTSTTHANNSFNLIFWFEFFYWHLIWEYTRISWPRFKFLLIFCISTNQAITILGTIVCNSLKKYSTSIWFGFTIYYRNCPLRIGRLLQSDVRQRGPGIQSGREFQLRLLLRQHWKRAVLQLCQQQLGVQRIWKRMEESRKDTRVAGTCPNDVSLFGIAAMMNDTYFLYEIIYIVRLLC